MSNAAKLGFLPGNLGRRAVMLMMASLYFTRCRLRYFQGGNVFPVPSPPGKGEKVADRPDEGADLE